MSAAIDRSFAALADPVRRRAIERLGQGPCRAGELAQALGLPAPAMSRHLRELKASGLVKEVHPAFDARVRIYSLRKGAMSALRGWIDQFDKTPAG